MCANTRPNRDWTKQARWSAASKKRPKNSSTRERKFTAPSQREDPVREIRRPKAEIRILVNLRRHPSGSRLSIVRPGSPFNFSCFLARRLEEGFQRFNPRPGQTSGRFEPQFFGQGIQVPVQQAQGVRKKNESCVTADFADRAEVAHSSELFQDIRIAQNRAFNGRRLDFARCG